MKTYNITHLILSDDSNFTYDFPVTLEDGTTSLLYTDAEFRTIIKNQYTSFCLYSPGYYDPDNKTWVDILPTTAAAIDELHKLYTLWIKDRKPAINKLLNALRMKYNPIWNVDGVTGHIEQSKHTGTDTDKKTGTEKIVTEDNGDVTNTGKTETTRSGNQENVRTGSETDTSSGTDTNTAKNTTYNSSVFRDVDKTEVGYGKSDTRTYNSVTDKETYNNVKDSTVIDSQNPIKEHRDLDGKHDTTYNTELKKTLNLTDENVFMDIRQGNIGVTSTQKLLREQLDLTELDDVISYAIHDFVHRYLMIIS